MNTVEIIDELSLTVELDQAIGVLLDEAFDGEFEGRSFHTNRHHRRYILRDGLRVVGHIGLCFRDIRQEDNLVSIGGIAEVACAQDQRGKGVASTLLTSVIEDAATLPIEFLTLFGTAKIYEGHGFVPANNLLRGVAMGQARTREIVEKPNDAFKIRPTRRATWDHETPVDLLGAYF